VVIREDDEVDAAALALQDESEVVGLPELIRRVALELALLVGLGVGLNLLADVRRLSFKTRATPPGLAAPPGPGGAYR